VKEERAKKRRQVFIQNPHGYGTWRQTDSDDTVLQRTDSEAKNEGGWWMDWHDFVTHFSRLDSTMSFVLGDWFHCQGSAMVDPATCGSSKEHWHMSPCFILRLSEPSSVCITVSQPCLKFIDGDEFYAHIGFRVVALMRDTRLSTPMVSAQLPPHRIAAHANQLQQHELIKASQSTLASVVAFQPCKQERQVATRLTLGPHVNEASNDESSVPSDLSVCYYIFLHSETSFSQCTEAPLTCDVYADHPFEFDRHNDGWHLDYHTKPVAQTNDAITAWSRRLNRVEKMQMGWSTLTCEHVLEMKKMENYCEGDDDEDAADSNCLCDLCTDTISGGRGSYMFYCEKCNVPICLECYDTALQWSVDAELKSRARAQLKCRARAQLKCRARAQLKCRARAQLKCRTRGHKSYGGKPKADRKPLCTVTVTPSSCSRLCTFYIYLEFGRDGNLRT